VEGRDLHDQISDLEDRVEELADSLQRCQKVVLIAKISIIAGGMLLLTIMLRLISFDPLAMIIAVTTIIGGIVVFGSTTTTAKQTSVSIKEAEALRTELISNLELRNVRGKQQTQGNGQHGYA
jgi:hypothetical protein